MKYLYLTLAYLTLVTPLFSQESPSDARARAAMAMTSSPIASECKCGCAESGVCTCGLKCPDLISFKKAKESKENTAKDTVQTVSSIEWRDYAEGMDEAESKGIPALVYVCSENCVYCDKLERDFKSPEMTSLITTGYIPIRVRAEAQPTLIRSFGIQSYPTLIVYGPDRRYRIHQRGYLPVTPLYNLLHPFAKNRQVSYQTYTTPPESSQTLYSTFPQVQATYALPTYSGVFQSYPRASWGMSRTGCASCGR